MLVVNLSARLALLILTGYIAGRLKVLTAEAKPVLVSLSMNVALPCLIVGSFGVNAVKGEALQFGYVILAAAVVLALSTLIGQLVYVLMKRSDAGAAAKLCIIFANVSFFGIPVAEALYPALLMYYNVFATVVRSTNYAFVVPLLGAKAEKPGARQQLRELLSPPFISILIGLAIYLSPYTLPGPVAGAVTALGSMTSPLGMIIIGLVLSNACFKDVIKKPVALFVTAMRLLIMPAIALGVMLLLGVGETLVKLVILFVAMPVGTLLPAYLMRYRPGGEGELTAGVCVCLTSVFCIFTIPAWAAILEYLY